MVAVSRAPLDKIAAFRERMGWSFKWVSSYGNEFNHDYYVSFTPQELSKGEVYYNYSIAPGAMEDFPHFPGIYEVIRT